MNARNDWWKFVLAIALIEAVGAGIGIVTAGQIGGWYQSLVEPPGTPPNWVFGPVWSVLYAMIAVSFVLFLKKGSGEGSCRAVSCFAIQLVLNFAWTPVFFGAHQLVLALVVIVSLNIAIWLTIRAFSKFSRLAAGLLIPYAIWVGYATYLNAGFVLLN